MKLDKFCRIKWEAALAFKKKGRFGEAKQELVEALEEQPDHPLLRASLAEAYLRQKRIIEAGSLAKTILSDHPEYPQALYILGEVSFRHKKLEKALEYFRQAAQKDSRPYLILRIAKVLREQGQYAEALETLDSALIKQKAYDGLLREKAVVLNRLGQTAAALKAYEDLLKIVPGDDFARKEVYRLKGRNRCGQEATDELKRIIKVSSEKNNPHLRGLLAQKLKEQGKLNDAAAEYYSAWQLNPDDLYLLKMAGFCYYRLGDYDKATEILSWAFKMEPGDYRVKATLTKLFKKNRDIKGFINLLEVILEDHPENMRLLGTLSSLKKQISQDDKGDMEQ
jgi:tetratricopeptide (TPR) repeat protein